MPEAWGEHRSGLFMTSVLPPMKSFIISPGKHASHRVHCPPRPVPDLISAQSRCRLDECSNKEPVPCIRQSAALGAQQ